MLHTHILQQAARLHTATNIAFLVATKITSVFNSLVTCLLFPFPLLHYSPHLFAKHEHVTFYKETDYTKQVDIGIN